MGINPNQHWVFFFLFAAVFIFSLGVILTGPGVGLAATQGQLVNIAGHQAILISPRLGSNQRGYIDAASLDNFTGDRPVLVIHPDALMQLNQGALNVERSSNANRMASTAVSENSIKSGTHSRPSHSFLYFGCVIASVLFGAKAGKRIMKSKNNLKSMSYLVEESLEDDLAFDIAYTTASSEVGYGSFVSSWAGDLEKFDV
jgi:hypothetical protein